MSEPDHDHTAATARTKLVLAVVPDHLANSALDTLLAEGCRVTRIASTGAFWRHGSTTLMAGVPETQVEQVLAALRRACEAGKGDHVALFVLDVARAERLEARYAELVRALQKLVSSLADRS